MSAEPILILLLLLSTLVDFYCGKKIGISEKSVTKKKYLLLSIFVNIGILIAFKYLFFFIDSFNVVLEAFGITVENSKQIQTYSINQVFLPVGISFYTFQTLSYTIEVYRGNMNHEKHLGRFALYVAFFPQLVAGPIEKATRLLPQFTQKVKANYNEIKKGLILMAWGYFLKVVVADRLGVYVDIAYSDPEAYSGLPLIIASFFFAFQIYFDFAAYTAIALGAARTMGIRLINNFDRPWFSKNITEFWRRWHISLTRWIGDYIYLPMVKSGRVSKLLAVFIVFFIIGLWHGANWTFVIWGLLNAFYLVLEVSTTILRKRIFGKIGLAGYPERFIGWVTGVILIVFSLIFFRSQTLSDAILFISNIPNIKNLHINIADSYFELILSCILILSVQSIHYFKGNEKVYELVTRQKTVTRWSMYMLYIAIVVLFAINRQSTFIYFQF